MDATAALSVLDDTQSTPRISKHSQSDTEWSPGFSAGRGFQDSESESECPARPKTTVLDVLTLQCRILQRLLESKTLIL